MRRWAQWTMRNALQWQSDHNQALQLRMMIRRESNVLMKHIFLVCNDSVGDLPLPSWHCRPLSCHFATADTCSSVEHNRAKMKFAYCCLALWMLHSAAHSTPSPALIADLLADEDISTIETDVS